MYAAANWKKTSLDMCLKMTLPFQPTVTVGTDQKSFFTNDEVCSMLVDAFDKIWKNFKPDEKKTDGAI